MKSMLWGEGFLFCFVFEGEGVDSQAFFSWPSHSEFGKKNKLLHYYSLSLRN